ncbi:MAG: hypothetical protein JSR46_09585 [Verrucomicrobia bacterium]|nr:hypothetical protein [Verrucomicrobiota bacterium]
MGGCSGIRAAKLVQKIYQDKNISAVVDRGYYRLEDVIRQRASGCAQGLAFRTMRCIEWDVSCDGEPELGGHILAIGANEDQTVPLESFYGNSEEVKKLKNLEVLYISGDDSSPDPHTRYWTEQEQGQIGDALRRLTATEKEEAV